MKIKELKKGYRIEYKFISEEQLKYAQTPILTEAEAESKMDELKEDKSVQDFLLINVKYY
jgi:hypothetical protein